MGRISDDATRIPQKVRGAKGCRCVWFGSGRDRSEEGFRREGIVGLVDVHMDG